MLNLFPLLFSVSPSILSTHFPYSHRPAGLAIMKAITIIAASSLSLHCSAYLPPLPSAHSIHGRRSRLRTNTGPSVAFGKKNDDDDGEWLDLNAPIDFTNLENKTLDRDSINMGWIRSLESPQRKQRVEPLTEKELERYKRRTRRLQMKEGKERFVDKWFPWMSPLMAFFIPRKFSTAYYGRVPSKNYVNTNILSGPDSGRNLLITINIVAFIYQIITAVQYLPGFNRILASSVAGDALSAASLGNQIPQWTRTEVVLRALGIIGAGSGVAISSSRGIAAHSMGPFFLDFAHQPYPLSYYQKHRYLTSGFLHGSLVHLGMNLKALISLPNWLENGIGKGLYLSAYLVAIVSGNLAHSFSTLGELPGRASSTLTIGASGGICGLYGLLFSCLWRMSNSKAATYVAKQMLWLVAFGYLVPNVSNAAHIGGFIGGVAVGHLFGPSYFVSRGRGSDNMDPEFRSVAGPGKL